MMRNVYWSHRGIVEDNMAFCDAAAAAAAHGFEFCVSDLYTGKVFTANKTKTFVRELLRLNQKEPKI
jgi:hypothetical protein